MFFSVPIHIKSESNRLTFHILVCRAHRQRCAHYSWVRYSYIGSVVRFALVSVFHLYSTCCLPWGVLDLMPILKCKEEDIGRWNFAILTDFFYLQLRRARFIIVISYAVMFRVWIQLHVAHAIHMILHCTRPSRCYLTLSIPSGSASRDCRPVHYFHKKKSELPCLSASIDIYGHMVFEGFLL